MKTYWDYSDKERSEMTEEFIKTLLDAELMTKGVLKVDPPSLRAVKVLPELTKIKYYKCVGVIFETAEQASKFLELFPMSENYNYQIGYDYKYAEPMDGKGIDAVFLYKKEELMATQKSIKEIEEAKEHNRKEESMFNLNSKAMSDVLNGVWEDWYRCQAVARERKKVVDTFEDYKKVAGDESLALEFLKKVFPLDIISESFKWFEIPITLEVITESAQ